MAAATDEEVRSPTDSTRSFDFSTLSTLGWYDRTRPVFIDLVGDYAGKELFLVDGESILRDSFSDERLDFKDGFQLLHAAYMVERFLENLIKRHCNFHIAFIEENAELCIPPGVSPKYGSRYLLARQVIKQHLANRLPLTHPDILVTEFASLDSREFREYLHHSAINFVMVHDGAIASNNTNAELELSDTAAKILLRGIIFWFNTHKLNVALLNRIEFIDSKVFTMVVESFTVPADLGPQMTLRFLTEMQQARSELTGFVKSDVLQEDNNEASVDLDFDKLEGSTLPLTESICLTVCTLSNFLKEYNDEAFLASAFAIHSILLRYIPLHKRRFSLVTFDEQYEEEIEDFLQNISTTACQIMKGPNWKSFVKDRVAAPDKIDLIDGRLLRIVIQGLWDQSLPGRLPQQVKYQFAEIASLVKEKTEERLSLERNADIESSNTTAIAADFKTRAKKPSLLPFSNPVFDSHLACIHITADASAPYRSGAMKVYRETTHWHNHRRPLNPKAAPVQAVSKWRNPLRLNQFYMREMTSYAASLTGATGKALVPETITVGPKQLVKIVEESPARLHAIKKGSVKPKDTKEDGPSAAKKGTKKAAAGLSKKEQMIADNKMRTEGKESDKVLSGWATVMKSFETTFDDQDRYLQASNYLNDLDSTKRAYLEVEVNMYILQSLLAWWAGYCKAGKKAQGYHVVALIWTTVRRICSQKSQITNDVAQHVTKVCSLVGISEALSPFISIVDETKLSFAFKYPDQALSLRIGISQTELQLNHCGPYMDRLLDAKPDPRVSNFIPDGWQRDVLDQLDAQKSVFVVAPTSAGKTFISFYAMEQVLRADNDGVLVYVAPTKALVNQIAAEVQGRFSKRFPLAGKGVWAIHTRDYRVNNSTGCQILVTVPHILQIMLLSPSNSKSWAPRLRRIIFDEIHSIGQAEDGVVWEQLLLLSPCPIIALSATVGNPEQFNSWLSSTQKVQGSEMKMIKHSTRYSDLRKYMFEPPTKFRFSGLGYSFGVGLGLDGLPGLEPFHPIASLVDKSRGMPDDLALEPRDCLSLWRAMAKYQNEHYKLAPSLDPAKALPSCVRKADIFDWERELKKVLLSWMADKKSPFDSVIAELSSSNENGSQSENTSSGSSGLSSRSDEVLEIDPDDLKSTTLPLLYQLHKRRALPAILFNYDRNGCEEIAETVLAQLVKAEKKWKEGPKWKKTMEGYEKYRELKEKKSRKPVKPVKKGNKDENDEGGSKLDRMRDEASEGASFYDLFDPDAPQPDFSFANPKVLQKAELEEFIRQLRRKYIRESLIELLKRGIGVHHAGMNRKYRQCVEMLFRKGFLRVVVATGTLSLGINMPCATVVFSGDSVYLTALNFRQAAGRSGRRGFDLLGNVVFQGISKERASRLLSSKLPDLTGHFPITTTLILRLFTLLHGSNNSAYAKKAIDSLLSQPRLYLGGESFKEQVLHHLRFSIEYLRMNDLLGPGGEPVNLTSCVSHLYFTENSSFAFHALLKGGYFHKLCEEVETKTSIVLLEMMLVLSHLFGRRPTKEVDDPEEQERIKRSSSIVYLPPMPEAAANIMRQHNTATLDIFTTYVQTFAAQHIKHEEASMPLTQTPLCPAEASKTELNLDFLPSLPSPCARSVFVALSGLGDEFTSIEDLCSSTRAGVFLESAVIPHLELHPDETKTPLNAYLLDFYKHGAIQPLSRANGIRKSDVWFLLNDFSMILATIVTSLANYLGFGSGDELEMLDVMGSGDQAENVGDEEIAAAVIPDPPAATSAAANSIQVPVFSKKSKKVVDDWDAGEDALQEEEKFLATAQMNGQSLTDDEEYKRLMNVYKGFRMLKTEFDEKFRAIWA